MVGSAQKAPGAGAAITALNLAVVRTAVFKRAAAQITERTDHAIDSVVRAAEQSRNRNKTVSTVLESSGNRSDSATANINTSGNEFKSPDFSNEQSASPSGDGTKGASVDIKV